jgi:isopentenyldiphosphate isomerase
MEERVDILDEDGNQTGRTATKREVHTRGWFHPTVHVWFYTPNAMVLLQQRGKDKDTYPLLWDVSVAGHVAASEAIADAAQREVAEEIGLDIEKEALEKIGVFKSVQQHGEDLIDCEFHHTFLCRLSVPFQSLTKQDSEVEALKLIPLTQLAEEIWGLARPQKYVPHSMAYYKGVIKAIRERL